MQRFSHAFVIVRRLCAIASPQENVRTLPEAISAHREAEPVTTRGAFGAMLGRGSMIARTRNLRTLIGRNTMVVYVIRDGNVLLHDDGAEPRDAPEPRFRRVLMAGSSVAAR